MMLPKISFDLGCQNEPDIRCALERDDVLILDLLQTVLESTQEKEGVLQLRGVDAEDFIKLLQSVCVPIVPRPLSVLIIGSRLPTSLAIDLGVLRTECSSNSMWRATFYLRSCSSRVFSNLCGTYFRVEVEASRMYIAVFIAEKRLPSRDFACSTIDKRSRK
jgi:hypothetical protein